MRDPIFSNRKRFGCFALTLLFLITPTIIFSTRNPILYTFTISAQNIPEIGLPQLVPPSPNHEKQTEEALCRLLKRGGDYCEIEGDVRVDSNSSTVLVIKPAGSNATSWTIHPYPRRRIPYVKPWTVRVESDHNTIPKCTHNHPHPAILFSVGGYAGNHFHSFIDILFPLFETSFNFETNVHFLISNYKPWWISKYLPLLQQLTRHPILNVDHQKPHIHCYNKLIASLRVTSHRYFHPDPSSEATTSQFRQLLRRAYSLPRNKVVVGSASKPRLMFVSRKRSRILLNEAEILGMTAELGFEVVAAEANHLTNLTEFAQLVNSCDVMMGIHGAGLTNMVFLPDKAVLVQVVPWGSIVIFANLDFGNPCSRMNMSYLDYRIELNESSLLRDYAIDDPVIQDPVSIHRQGWGVLRNVYLHNQNITIDVDRFRPTLVKALHLVRP